ncbi:formiminoglutamase [Staphylococcus auricularis]|uniref:Formimidoylglutamase n=1 Tax=Staphylococcus auricularis TaxID=29379 RepID=A0AAP8TTF5_9STAP|nr:formimidoylglutamase [Staphylococcus auricularis]MBM0867372.1 formimidoylglutamase [Staphylococcus auricularis]MCG7341237.1 formimidoylglutamase [Staphylococcus auricularis]MDC6327643.1 formimidoylglutamase [Staphylococcus auricularis]MDN4533595.1 formimidoylglutamase [Staphylococcus auricularis]PNZ68067.1 formimidoylglutamase [Staphylococcus auricularis]
MYQLANTDLWKGRVDSETDESQFRLFQTVNFKDLTESADSKGQEGIGILGYAVDKGVELNKGRVGAKEGPDAIRKAFAGLPKQKATSVTDYGNVIHDADQLEETQEAFADLVNASIQRHKQTFLFGGGHDIAYAQYLGLRKAYPDASIGVINIDAHFDTRQADYSTSGTSFRQILDQDDNADYFVLGIQHGGNTQNLFDYAEAKDISYVYADELFYQVAPPVKDKVERFIHDHDVIMFTICMDVIDSAYAPGVSASCVLGLSPQIVLEIAKRIIPNDKVSTISIAETNPTYDIDSRTAKLAATFFYHFMS